MYMSLNQLLHPAVQGKLELREIMETVALKVGLDLDLDQQRRQE